MRVSYAIEAPIYTLEGVRPGAKAFVQEFGADRRSRTRFGFATERRALQALASLRELGLIGHVIYDLEVPAEEVGRAAAVWLPVDLKSGLLAGVVVKSAKMRATELAADLVSGVLVAKPRAKELLERNASGISWRELADGLFALEQAAILRDPMRILSVSVKIPSASGWRVESDGRDVLTERDLTRLRKMGIALVSRARVGGEAIDLSPRYAVAGQTAAALLEAGVAGLRGPIRPLLPESDPLVSGR